MTDPDAPFDQLVQLPRGTWLLGVVGSVGVVERRLASAQRWLAALSQGLLPEADAHFGDHEACAPLRQVVGDLGLPALCQHTPALAEQVLRTVLWHLDHIVNHQPRLSRAAAIQAVTEEFREAWRVETAGLEHELQLLMGLGNFSELQWDSLRGHLRSRAWAQALEAAERLAQLPALARLIRQLGRAERSVDAAPSPTTATQATAAIRLPVRLMHTRLPDAPGEITGVRWSARIERMLASEAVMLRHPVLKKLWRARHAEARLLSWETEAVLADWRPDPLAHAHAHAIPDEPETQERGPIILCLDTSGSMHGAPEKIAKAVVIAAMQSAHETGRACRLIAFGGPGECLEHNLHHGAAGLHAMLKLMEQSFDGGTDIQTPIDRAIATVLSEGWRSADVLIVSDGEFGCVPQTLEALDQARASLGLRVQGVLVGDRETMGLLEVCDHIHWEREWRRFAGPASGVDTRHFSPVHSKSLTALYFPNALSARAARHHAGASDPDR